MKKNVLICFRLSKDDGEVCTIPPTKKRNGAVKGKPTVMTARGKLEEIIL
jgi:hypothetical protein